MNPDVRKESSQGLSIDRAALILLRVKRVFRKKKQQRNKDKQSGDGVHMLTKSASIKKHPPPLLRSRTLPAIVVPGLSILQAQISDNRSSSTLDTTCDGNSNTNMQSVLPSIIYDSNSLDPRRHLVHHRLSSPEASAGMSDAMLQLKISQPPRLSASGPSTTQTALYRLARLLNQNQKSPEAFHSATRRLSWERDEETEDILNIPRSASIDSIVESRHCGVNIVRKLPSPLLNRGSTTPPLSPAIARRLKGTRAVTSLFAAVEHGHVDKTRTILESADVNVNSMNSDGFTPLDVAILSNNLPLVKLLITFGAQEGNKFSSPDKLGAHLRHLLLESERRCHELGGTCLLDHNSHHHSTLSINRGSISVADSDRSDKTLALWERRCKGLKKMLLGFDQARPPDMPSSVSVEVTGITSVCVRYQEPDNSASPLCTKYKVEWSTDPDFKDIVGSQEILNSRQHDLEISNLIHRQRYYFRAACGNIRGYSLPKVSTPSHVEPSSWRDCSGLIKTERISSDGLALLDRLFGEMKNERPDLKTFSEAVENGGGDCGKRKKTTIKQLFTAASKFQKHLKRGVFLSCLLYHEDKVLVTNEDFLPVIEIDDTYPNSIYQDFHWLLKVSCTWEDIKLLRNEMEKSLSNSNTSNHFRVKLLNASLQMQTALSIENLGQLYHRPIKDSEGTIVIPLINYVKNVKSISVLNSRWLPLTKLTKRTNLCNLNENNVSETLMASVQDQITYHQVSRIKLSKGLYLGYLKMRSSVDLLQVLVPSKSPNVPPHCKVRDNPHVTADEWEVLRSCNSNDKLNSLTEQQRMFLEHVALTLKRLFRYMEVSDEDCALHRLYDSEVIEISAEVSLVMIVPPVESACSVPGQRELLLQRPDLLPLPVQVFEMVHLGTYQRSLVSKYSRLSCILQLDTALAQQGHREAFSNTEVSLAKERLSRLETLQSRLNTTWKQTRWLLDVLSFARDRLSSQCPPSVKYLLSLCNSSTETSSSSCFLQPPDPKNVKSRGSWPGPGVGRLLGSVTAELSRSEQQLSGGLAPPLPPRPPPPAPLPIPSIELAGPNTNKLAPSRSDDVLIQHTQAPPTNTTRTSSSATTSPLLATRLQGYTTSTTPPTVNISSSLQSLSSDDSPTPQIGEEDGAALPTPTPGIIQVYAAYNTGLAPGTSLMLHVSPRTCAREVVNLVVKEVNMAVLVKGKAGPIYSQEELSNFCLVAVLGPRERCLRDDFKPLQLQNPWKKGRLYVRQKHDKLAALDQSSRHSTFL